MRRQQPRFVCLSENGKYPRQGMYHLLRLVIVMYGLLMDSFTCFDDFTLSK